MPLFGFRIITFLIVLTQRYNVYYLNNRSVNIRSEFTRVADNKWITDVRPVNNAEKLTYID
jgi:hypothetical protein